MTWCSDLKLSKNQQALIDVIKYFSYAFLETVLSISCALKLFVRDNQGGTDTTVINHIGLYGSLRDTTNMKDFKRVRPCTLSSFKIVR